MHSYLIFGTCKSLVPLLAFERSHIVFPFCREFFSPLKQFNVCEIVILFVTLFRQFALVHGVVIRVLLRVDDTFPTVQGSSTETANRNRTSIVRGVHSYQKYIHKDDSSYSQF